MDLQSSELALKRKNIILNFQTWLNKQQDRDDLIGELARQPQMQNVEHKPARPKKNEHKDWVDIVVNIADPQHRFAFNDAWQEYIQYKDEIEGTLD